jgi:hypothetical protein
MVNWRKSTYSGANGGDCIEVAREDDILIRDSKNSDGEILRVPFYAWKNFVASLRH